MPDRDPPRSSVPESRNVPKKRTRLSLVWFIPILAAVVGAWVAVTRVLSEGPKITIVMKSAEGLEAGKTKIHYNGVDIGTISNDRTVERSSARDPDRPDGAQDGRISGRRHEVLGRAAANIRRQRYWVGHSYLRSLHRRGDRIFERKRGATL